MARHDGLEDDLTPPTADPHFSAQDVRGGEIILRTRQQRMIFFGGLIGFVILALVLDLAGIA
jgi:hypothetical protein